VRIGVSLHFVKKSRVGGAEHMAYNVVRGLLALGQSVVIACSNLKDLDEAFLTEVQEQSACDFVIYGASQSRFMCETQGARLLARRCDGVIYPNYFTPPTVLFTNTPTLTVVHDLQYMHFPEFFPLKKRLWLRVAHLLTLRLADKVVAISGFVKQDMVNCYGKWCEKKIVVIHNPISWNRFETSRVLKTRIKGPYILSVAADYPHKNLITILDAFEAISPLNPELKLVLVGQFSEKMSVYVIRDISLTEYIDRLCAKDRIIIMGYVDDDELGALYRSAKVFLFPSLFEGFGMPPVEALGLGKPVIVSSCTALPETTLGYATQYIENPRNVQEWSSAIQNVLDVDGAYPSDEHVALIKQTYAPDIIASRYVELLFGPKTNNN